MAKKSTPEGASAVFGFCEALAIGRAGEDPRELASVGVVPRLMDVATGATRIGDGPRMDCGAGGNKSGLGVPFVGEMGDSPPILPDLGGRVFFVLLRADEDPELALKSSASQDEGFERLGMSSPDRDWFCSFR